MLWQVVPTLYNYLHKFSRPAFKQVKNLASLVFYTRGYSEVTIETDTKLEIHSQ